MLNNSAIGGIIKAIVGLVGSNVLGQLFLFIILPVTTYIYSPVSMGMFAFSWAIVNVISVVSGLRFELAIPLPKLDRDAKRIFTRIVQLNFLFVILSFVLSCLVFLLMPDDEVNYTILFIPLGVMTIGLYRACLYYNVRKENFNNISESKLYQSFGNGACQLILGFGTSGLAAMMMLSFILGQCFGVKKLFDAISTYNYKDLLDLKFKSRDIFLLKKYSKFPKYDVPAALIDTISAQLPNLTLAIVFNPVIAGVYLLADKLLITPASVMSQAFSQVFLAKLSASETQEERHLWLIRLLLMVSSVSIIYFFVFYFSVDLLVVRFLDSAWYDVADIIQILLIGICFQMIYSPLSMALVVSNSQHISLIIHIMLLTLKLSSLVYAYIFSDYMYFVYGIAMSNSLVYASAIFYVFYRARFLKVGY